jgi:ABC-type microcin C transport system permease subunit YejB
MYRYVLKRLLLVIPTLVGTGVLADAADSG